ncbi:glycosyltransferase family 2 protein [Patescibacteria group bacterium]|nr:glycosyltransferase family 2 protein [Patescibacteria group bacterium]
MDLSIIIVSYNTKKLTLDCIKSVINEGSGLKKEIIVVDNGSKDGSTKEIEEYSRQTTLRLIKNRTNLGFSKANNQGIKSAKGKYILLLNSDTKVKKEVLGKLVKFAEKTPDVGVVGARLLNEDGTLQGSCFHFPTIKNAIREYFLGKKGLFDKFAPGGEKPVEVEALVGAAFLITPKALEEVGPLDERYFFYMEDLDYCRRVWRAGLKVYYLPEAEVFHYHGASGKHIADPENQWRRQIPSSKIYHGLFKHYLLTAVLWSGQKWQRLFKLFYGKS